ncbi:hypothetical protein VNO77_33361 [Canavalia gladiata]|uniref:3-hydroxyisobutyryl-CoA hydrolase n=1 Tax=Canavalia gladiata TaxID=3824 RepID=A0AAN9KEK8_CANGL
MALCFTFDSEANQVLFTGNSDVKTVVLNRPEKLNTLCHEMLCQILKNIRLYENDPSVKLVIIKANGKVFSAGGDVVSVITCSLAGHWSYITMYYKKLLTLQYFMATYRKPSVSLIHGFAMGAGACLSMNTKFRVVTEKTVFAMPEASIGLFPDAGASYILSRLPGYLGEYIGLTGAKLDGAEMVACGLATHFVPSVKLNALENALQTVTSNNVPIGTVIEKFTVKVDVKEGSSLRRLETINKCFSKGTAEEIIICLWEPSKLELVSEEMVDQCFRNMNDEDFGYLQLPDRSNPEITSRL